ncbi:BatD family protein [Shewanella acanthi]|uniref:BatD family protein n=1 Tax=Shewanella acanthi TaxID=2864212 RepID=UPI001C66117E|nr:BatD family protein [Shewanella acanthi]QYJ78400.1 BatD family protein [Shewanella acanthi]
MLLLLVVLLPKTPVYAAENTASPAEVKVNAWLGSGSEPEEKLWAPTEQILLQIEVSTNRWFTSGTQIKGIEIANVLVKQRNAFAVNYTEQENGQTWSHQRWEIALYPQASGEYVIPAATVLTQVADESGQKRSVTLMTPSMPFRVALPSAELADSKPWFAASKVQLVQDWSLKEGDVLTVGDSLVRTIKIEANDTLSVLIPHLMPMDVSPMWRAYPNSPELVDKQNRDGYVSTRQDSQTYVLQQGGEVHWPEYQLWWWNTQTGQLEQIQLEGKTLKVRHTLSSWLHYYAWHIVVFLLLATGTWLIVMGLKRYYHNHPTPLWLSFYRSLLKGEWGRCRQLLYQRLRDRKQVLALSQLSQEAELQAAALRVQTDGAKPQDFRSLWQAIRQSTSKWSKWWRLPKALPALANVEVRKSDDSA